MTLRNDVSSRSGGHQLAVWPLELHACGAHPRAQAHHIGAQLKVVTNAGAQVVNAQIDGAQLAKALQASAAASSATRGPSQISRRPSTNSGSNTTVSGAGFFMTAIVGDVMASECRLGLACALMHLQHLKLLAA